VRKFKGSLLTTIGAVALTLGAATAALAVNAGILRSAPDTGVGNLETEATVPVTTEDPNVRYVTVFVDDPVAGDTVTTLPATPAAPVATTAGTAPGVSWDDDGDDHDESEYEDDDDHDDFDDDHDDSDDSDDDHDDDGHEYEGADDDD
jgi:hypothetical protein